MKFHSTRNPEPRVGLSEALQTSLAPDGGLYVPERFPRYALRDFDGAEELADIAAIWLRPFFASDPLGEQLGDICRETFTFPIPLRPIEHAEILELFHGPTAAFKDVGARFLAACLQRLPCAQTRTVLVATSGDTGGAVAAAFHDRPGFRVIVLFPKGKVSARQEKQLTAWGGNVSAFAVHGDFDDCQRLTKAAFCDPWWQSQHLISANSINLGRLLPQASYYAAASLWHLRRHGSTPGFIVPSGNLGNVTGALWARQTGMPIGEIVLATNENRTLLDYVETGEWRPRPTVATLANAMDVGNPSNIERIRQLYPDHASFCEHLKVVSVTDAEIRAALGSTDHEICPHTATAVHAMHRLTGDWIVVATAHPAKFESIVEPVRGLPILVPPALQELLDRESWVREIEPDLNQLRELVSR